MLSSENMFVVTHLYNKTNTTGQDIYTYMKLNKKTFKKCFELMTYTLFTIKKSLTRPLQYDQQNVPMPRRPVLYMLYTLFTYVYLTP